MENKNQIRGHITIESALAEEISQPKSVGEQVFGGASPTAMPAVSWNVESQENEVKKILDALAVSDLQGKPLGSAHDVVTRLVMELGELREKARRLQDVDAALKVLLKQRDEDRRELERTITTNIKNLILPYLQRLESSHLGKNQLAWVRIIALQLDEITSTFGRKSLAEQAGLTAAEQRVISLLKEGKTTKEMAEILGVSQKTISCHRDRIRTKLDLKGKPSTLRSFLLDLE